MSIFLISQRRMRTAFNLVQQAKHPVIHGVQGGQSDENNSLESFLIQL